MKKCLNQLIIFILLSTPLLSNSLFASHENFTVTVKPSTEPNCNGFLFHFDIVNSIDYKIIDLSEKKIIDQRMSTGNLSDKLNAKFSFNSSNIKKTNVWFAYNPLTHKRLSKATPACYTYNYKTNYTISHLMKSSPQSSVVPWKNVNSDHFLILGLEELGKTFSEYVKREINIAGFAREGTRMISISANRLNGTAANDFYHLVLHEEGHRLGLPHHSNPYECNLMSYKGYPCSNINEQQKQVIVDAKLFINNRFVKMQDTFLQPMKNTFTEKTQYSFPSGESAKTEVEDFLNQSYSGVSYYP